MNSLNVFFVTALLLFCGCAHDSKHFFQEAPIGESEPPPITVYVAGGVKKPDRYTLGRLFTVQHAIEQAEGFSEPQGNRTVRVIHKDGRGVRVPRKKDAT